MLTPTAFWRFQIGPQFVFPLYLVAGATGFGAEKRGARGETRNARGLQNEGWFCFHFHAFHFHRPDRGIVSFFEREVPILHACEDLFSDTHSNK